MHLQLASVISDENGGLKLRASMVTSSLLRFGEKCEERQDLFAIKKSGDIRVNSSKNEGRDK